MDKESIMGECLIIRSGGGTDTSDATATSDVVLSGYTCYVNDELVTGSMIAQNPGNQSLTPGGEYAIEEGYYDGTDEISVTSLSDNTSADATAGYILTGYNAWVNGSNVSGSMANQGNVSQSLVANGSYTIPAGWHAGAGVVNQSLATQGAVNVTPGTANKTACAANRWTTGSIIILGSSSLVASNIRNGVTIFGVKGTFVGWVDSTWQCASYNLGKTYVTSSTDGSTPGWTRKEIYSIDSTQASKLSSTFSKLRMYGWIWGQGTSPGRKVAAQLSYQLGSSVYYLVSIVTNNVADSTSATRDIPMSSLLSRGIEFRFDGGGNGKGNRGWVAAKATLTYIK